MAQRAIERLISEAEMTPIAGGSTGVFVDFQDENGLGHRLESTLTAEGWSQPKESTLA